MLGRRYNTVTLFKSIVQRYARIQIALDRVPFSSAALADVEEDHFNLEVKDEYPKPDPKFAEIIRALPRAKTKRHAAVQLRKAGRIPSIIFECENGQQGGNKRLISVETKQIRNLLRKMGESFFRSRIYDIEVRSASDSEVIVEKGRVLPRLRFKCQKKGDVLGYNVNRKNLTVALTIRKKNSCSASLYIQCQCNVLCLNIWLTLIEQLMRLLMSHSLEPRQMLCSRLIYLFCIEERMRAQELEKVGILTQ
ncbi:uncharacterized protein LOC131057409 isoform X3 [Cryptomeria japonica]|uniref:uncharacterized protein LOC131057409 isoform X3 n=1 Tax=Cryptomeria japonica TaxID=3369 RepID=UPI0027DA868B|nr:uncharacterized protein LOC131057409 isoform X3 [Cryptomeria japonica]